MLVEDAVVVVVDRFVDLAEFLEELFVLVELEVQDCFGEFGPEELVFFVCLEMKTLFSWDFAFVGHAVVVE